MAEQYSISGDGFVSMEGAALPRAEIKRELFPGDWTRRLQRLFFQNDERSFANDQPPLHAPRLLRSGNPSAYVPHFISFGPYHYRGHKLEVDYLLYQEDSLMKISTKEAYKVKFVAKLPGSTIREIFAMIESRMGEIVRFYYGEGDVPESKNLALMMMVDSIFLFNFVLLNDDHGQHAIGIKCDILKLENQIPLLLLKQVHEVLRNSVEPRIPVCRTRDDIWGLLKMAHEKLSPFRTPDNTSGGPHLLDNVLHQPHLLDNVLHQPHLLGCIHAIVSATFLTIRDVSLNSSCIGNITRGKMPIKLYTAGELARAGIKFKPFTPLLDKIWFDKFSKTFYLPSMTLSSAQTEVFFRNMLALEFVDPCRGDKVTRFIQLMLCLIDTAEDVEELRKYHVISRECLFTNEHIARIWDSIRKPFSYGHVNPPPNLKQALDEVLEAKYRMIKFRIAFCDFWRYYYQKYFSKPWNIAALVVGLFVLAMNTLVAYCTVRECNSDHSKKLHYNL